MILKSTGVLAGRPCAKGPGAHRRPRATGRVRDRQTRLGVRPHACRPPDWAL